MQPCWIKFDKHLELDLKTRVHFSFRTFEVHRDDRILRLSSPHRGRQTPSSMRPDAPARPPAGCHSRTRARPGLVLLFSSAPVRQKGENGRARSAARLPREDTTIAQTRQVDVMAAVGRSCFCNCLDSRQLQRPVNQQWRLASIYWAGRNSWPVTSVPGGSRGPPSDLVG